MPRLTLTSLQHCSPGPTSSPCHRPVEATQACDCTARGVPAILSGSNEAHKEKELQPLHRCLWTEPERGDRNPCPAVQRQAYRHHFCPQKDLIKTKSRASLVAQWLRICLLMQGTWVRALVWEDPTCRGATRPVSQNY